MAPSLVEESLLGNQPVPIPSSPRGLKLNVELTQFDCPPSHSSLQVGLMYSDSQREVGEHNDRVCLEVEAEFFSGHLEGQSRLLEMSISSFYLG